KRGRGAEGKALICIALEKKKDDPKPGRVRMEVIPDTCGDTISKFVQRNVEIGATIRSDGLPSSSIKLPQLPFPALRRYHS
ncbi:MAG TPA: IS1595 family transposase, partial [Spirochaetaceae bacterium]|nr:IS1595 family transposase [Spirochaetaceae bacterium]HAX36900.1 IS1595 family transposase [Spirochaetaceae bacterium]